VIFGTQDDAGPDDVVLALGNTKATPHAFGCTCCLPRTAAAQALGQLFLARARGEMGFFRRVIAAPEDAASVRAAVTDDVLVAARFRLD
jgi:hypothetical protein